MDLSVAVRAENVNDFMLVQILHVVTRYAAVFTRIELTRFLGEDFTNSSGESQTAVGVL